MVLFTCVLFILLCVYLSLNSMYLEYAFLLVMVVHVICFIVFMFIMNLEQCM